MTGSTGIEQALGNSYRCRDWCSPIEEDLVVGQSRHEFGVFVDDKLLMINYRKCLEQMLTMLFLLLKQRQETILKCKNERTQLQNISLKSFNG